MRYIIAVSSSLVQNTDEDYSYGSTSNTSSRNETGSITIRIEFEVD